MAFDWEWTRTEFRKALIAGATAAADVGLDEGLGLFQELQACALLLLHNFQERLSVKQQRDLSNLVAACEFDSCELRDDPEWDDQYTREYIEEAIKYARESTPLFEGI